MSEIYDEGLLPPNVHPSRTDRRAMGPSDTDADESSTDRSTQDQQVGDVADQGLLPPNVNPSRTDRTADDGHAGAQPPPAEADTDDQLPGTDDGLHGEAGNEQAADPSASDPILVPEPEEVPERDPDVAPPTAPERAPAPDEDPEVPPLTDPEFDFRDPQRPGGTPI
ncbi:MAG: hypothetical protein LBE05_02055 [Microbacterium sp.]|jgi:hypothetical protein|nr:hypothetical protein [Microbacterium sp.]